MRLTGSVALGFVLLESGGAQAHVRLSRALLAPFDPVQAIAATGQAGSGEDPYARGKRLLGGDDVISALSAFRQALTQTPQSADVLNGIAVCYDRLGRPDVARGYYEAGLAIAPASAPLLNNFGYSLYLQGDRDAAIAPLRAAAVAKDLPEVAAAAWRTLALIAAADGQRHAPVPAVVPAAARVEVTNDGEQRLVIGDRARPPDEVAALGEAATLAVVAPAWTAERDRMLLAEVRDEERAIALTELRASEAARDREDVAEAVTLRPAAQHLFDVPLDTGGSVRAFFPAGRASGPAAGLDADLGGHAPSNAVLAAEAGPGRQVAGPAPRPAVGGARRAIAGQRPVEAEIAAVYESDDARLNAFAARMSRGGKVTPELARLAASVRAA